MRRFAKAVFLTKLPRDKGFSANSARVTAMHGMQEVVGSSPIGSTSLTRKPTGTCGLFISPNGVLAKLFFARSLRARLYTPLLHCFDVLQRAQRIVDTGLEPVTSRV